MYVASIQAVPSHSHVSFGGRRVLFSCMMCSFPQRPWCILVLLVFLAHVLFTSPQAAVRFSTKDSTDRYVARSNRAALSHSHDASPKKGKLRVPVQRQQQQAKIRSIFRSFPGSALGHFFFVQEEKAFSQVPARVAFFLRCPAAKWAAGRILILDGASFRRLATYPSTSGGCPSLACVG
jgi:hypothetical protein